VHGSWERREEVHVTVTAPDTVYDRLVGASLTVFGRLQGPRYSVEVQKPSGLYKLLHK
jgi:hypothetical protein